MMGRLRAFLRMATWEKMNYLSAVLCRIKTAFLYRPFFGRIGSGSSIGRPLLISRPDRIFIGRNVYIRSGARLEVIQARASRVPVLEIGDDTNLEQNVHIACHSRIRIGNRVSITANCVIVDVNHPLSPGASGRKVADLILDEDAYVEIGDGAVVGTGTVVLPNVRIGEGAFIGAHSVVTSDVPPFAIAVGAPATVRRIYGPGKEGEIKN